MKSEKQQVKKRRIQQKNASGVLFSEKPASAQPLRLFAAHNARLHDRVDTLADLDRRLADELLCRDDVQHVEPHLRMLAEHVAQDRAGVDQRTDHDGDIGLLHNLEYAAAVGKQGIGRPVRPALGEHSDGGLVVLDELDGLEDGLERLAVVIPVDRQAEHLAHDLRDDEDREIFLL